MAKKVKQGNTSVDDKELNSFAEEFVFASPEKDEDGYVRTPRYKTGVVMFDRLTNGGLPQGKVITISSEEGVGKTTLTIQLMGNIVEQYDKKAVFIDGEGGATLELFQKMGYYDLLWHPVHNPDGKFYLLEAETIQQVSKIIKKFAADPECAAIALDSTYSPIDEKALESDVLGTDNGAVGSKARMWSSAAGPISAVIKRSKACLILIHQSRTNLSGFRPQVEASSNKALKHMTSVEIWGRRIAWIGENYDMDKVKPNEAVGAYVALTTKKNRLTKPFSTVEIPVIFGRGVSNKYAYKDWMEKHVIVDDVTGEATPMVLKAGSWITVTLPNGTKEKVQGDMKLWEIIDQHYDSIVQYVESHGGFEVRKAMAHELEGTELD